MNVLKIATILSVTSVSSAAILGLSCSPAQAFYSRSFSLEEFTGSNAGGSLTLTEADGSVIFNFSITQPTINGDIAAFAFDLFDGSDDFLNSLLISDFSSNLGQVDFTTILGTDAVCAQSSFTGGNSANPCNNDALDFALDFGKGSSGGYLTDFTFTLSSSASSLSLSDFSGSFSARYQSTGSDFEDSSKLGYYFPGYMGTTSNVVYISENQTPPEGAVPLTPEVEPEKDNKKDKGNAKKDRW